ncbi:MAG TPA: RagB/SusD family nutrient uptake outer membrane protein [Rikenellaceae bacterium]|nr:RagB/SusD family nutrient uptake outer membrane protein [Rikenellaceae bacterium]
MKKIIIPVFCGLALIASSCQSKLDIPQKGVISYDDFYASDADCKAALANMYAQYIQNVAATEGIDNPEQVILNYSSDDILAAGGNKNDHMPFRAFDEFRYDDANTTLKQAYQRYYYGIYHANLIISNFTNENKDGAEPKFTSDYTKQAVAEARVMRAYLHFMLAAMWNCPPIIDRVYEADELPVNAESQSQVLTWVISECEKAISSGYLPERKDVNDKDATARMSKGFAQFIAGKAAMFNNDPATARKYLGDLIASGKYDLVPSEDYWINFHVPGDGSCEKIFEPNVIGDPDWLTMWGGGAMRTRWMVSNVFCWRTDVLASTPTVHSGFQGWNGGAITIDFAKKFLEHDGDSPRRRACFLTEEEWLYEMDWDGSSVNDGTLEQKKADPNRGIKAASGVWSHGPYFEWKHMNFMNPPKILTGGREYEKDNIDYLGKGFNGTNFKVARYAEALLLYAEACIGSADEAKGLKALQDVQKRSGSGKVDDELTFENVMEEKQYEMWFESCRFLDLVRWANQGKVDLDAIYNKSSLHSFDGKNTVPVVYDEFFTEGKPGYNKEHKLFTEKTEILCDDFVVGKSEYFPFPLDVKNANPNLHDVRGWAK